jgi:drug/metabolite transporter (DMT)-like permease
MVSRAFRNKLVKALKKEIDREDTHSRYIFLSRVIGISGCLLIFFAFYSDNLRSDTPSWLILIIGIFGGTALGLSTYFYNAGKQWPVILEFLNIDAVRNAQID